YRAGSLQDGHDGVPPIDVEIPYREPHLIRCHPYTISELSPQACLIELPAEYWTDDDVTVAFHDRRNAGGAGAMAQAHEIDQPDNLIRHRAKAVFQLFDDQAESPSVACLGDALVGCEPHTLVLDVFLGDTGIN